MSNAEQRNAAKETVDRIVLEGMRRYAEWDKSDPFTFNRCMTHYRQGLCRPLQDGTNGHYEVQVTSTPEGIRSFGNIKRV